MSTSYYYLREPIADLCIEERDHVLTVTVLGAGRLLPGGFARAREVLGTLRWPAEQQTDLVAMFGMETSDDSKCPMRTYYGGNRVGCVVKERFHGLDPELRLISEYGSVFTVAQIRSMAGKGKESSE